MEQKNNKQNALAMAVIQNELKKIINKRGIVKLDDKREVKVDLEQPNKQEIKDVVELLIVLPSLNEKIPQRIIEEIHQILEVFDESFDEAYEKVILQNYKEKSNESNTSKKTDDTVKQGKVSNMQTIQEKADMFNEFIRENVNKLPREYLNKIDQIRHIPMYKGNFNEVAPKNSGDVER